jgi:hypothetical protein
MKRWLSALLFLLILPATTPATTVLPMYLDDLTAASQTVAYGQVLASRVEWDAGHNWIFTVYTIAPVQYLKGNLGPTFELREPGGERDGVGMKVSGAPHFAVGQDAVFFIWTDPSGFHQVTAFEQGAVTIQTDPATGLQTAARSIALGTARAELAVTASRPSTSRALPQLMDQIRVSIASRRPRE